MNLFLAMPGNSDLADELALLTASEVQPIACRTFPDGESYVRTRGDARGADAFLICTLARPDAQFLPLVFAARALRAAGAKTVTLVAPYLPYLRQDRAFHEGEAISSRIFADLMGREFDRLVTVDPHLHRYASLDEVYSIPTTVVHSSALIGAWVRDNVNEPVILGPDSESAQWVEDIARHAGCPWTVFRKERHGDRNVQLSPLALDLYRERQPVLVDDIISSGATMIAAARFLMTTGMRAPHCIAIHALFDQTTASELRGLAQSLSTTDSVPNPYVQFSVATPIATELAPGQV